jgi:hypothetical protein
MQIKDIPTKSLIAIIASYRTFKINKDLAIKGMEELDKRKLDGYDIDLSEIDQITQLLKSVGKGFVIKTISENQIPDIIQDLNLLGITGIKVSEDTIFIGQIDQNKFSDISKITGIVAIEQDKETIENVINSKIPPVR